MPRATRRRAFVALLRGVNVGGRNRVAMSDLRGIVESVGHTHVATYIQSGNVVFAAQAGSEASADDLLAGVLHEAITARLGLDVDVMVRDREALAGVIAAVPFAGADPRQVLVEFLSTASDRRGAGGAHLGRGGSRRGPRRGPRGLPPPSERRGTKRAGAARGAPAQGSSHRTEPLDLPRAAGDAGADRELGVAGPAGGGRSAGVRAGREPGRGALVRGTVVRRRMRQNHGTHWHTPRTSNTGDSRPVERRASSAATAPETPPRTGDPPR